MILKEVYLSSVGLSLGFCLAYVFLSIVDYHPISRSCFQLSIYSILLACCLLYFIIEKCLRFFCFQVVCVSAVLGSVCGAGVTVASLDSGSRATVFGWYMVVVALFHWSEFVFTALSNRHSLTIDSFVVNHSYAYTVAAVVSWLEFWTEQWIWTDGLQWRGVSCAGLALCIGGELLRKSAMITAGVSFNHTVQSEKRSDHVLVTHGVFSLVRHPSYVGWFAWCLGTQLILCNPVCAVGYAAASWCYFRARVHVEETLLLRFFGDRYVDYMSRVPSGIPGVGLADIVHSAATLHR